MTDTTTPQPDANGWYTIDSAPRDGTIFLSWEGNGFVIVQKNKKGLFVDRHFWPRYVSHWKPLGPPPVGVDSAE